MMLHLRMNASSCRARRHCNVVWVVAGSRAGNPRAARRLRERRHAVVQ